MSRRCIGLGLGPTKACTPGCGTGSSSSSSGVALTPPAVPSVAAQTNPEAYTAYGAALEAYLEAKYGDTPVELRQADFDYGAVRILKPGKYVFVEDVTFHPNPANNFQPDDPEKYPDFTLGGAWHLGFFAAVTIETTDVLLDFNGHTLQQSAEHALVQKVYSHVETEDQPFVPKQGPADFGSTLTPAKNVVIRNGTLGQSSHHGIHGNGNRSIVVKDMVIHGFEVAGVALNGVSYGVFDNITIGPSRQDVEILGTYSQAHFIVNKLKKIQARAPAATFNGRTAAELLADLQTALARPGDSMFRNVARNIDALSYGFLLNVFGVAVNGFRTAPGDGDFNNCHVVVNRVSVRGLHSTTIEVPAVDLPDEVNGEIVYGTGDAVLTGPIGDVLQMTLCRDADSGAYVPNVLADAQMFVAKHGVGPAERGTTNIPASIVAWAEGGAYPDGYDTWVWGGDSMHHVTKGNVGLFLSGLRDAHVANVTVSDLLNEGASSKMSRAGNRCHGAQNIPYYDGSSCRGVALAGCANVTLDNITVSKIRAEHGSSSGFDVIGSSNGCEMKHCTPADVTCGTLSEGAGDVNAPPTALGFRWELTPSS